MRFEQGNQAAAKPSKKAVAASIRRRLERNADTLSNAEFTTLVSRFDKLTAKRPRRRRKDREAKKARETFADRLSPEEAEIHRQVLEIEAERREIGRKQWDAKQKEREREREREREPTPPAAAWIDAAFPGFNEHVRNRNTA